MRRLVKIIMALVLASYICSTPAQAASAVKISDEALVANVQAIVTGKVTRIESRWDAQRNNLYTDITVSLTEVIKGQINTQTIVVEQIGGRVGKSFSWLTGSPQFSLNEEVLLFLNTDARGVLHSAHLELGKFSISTNNETRLRTIVRPGELASPRVDAAQFIQHIKTLAATTTNLKASSKIQFAPIDYIPGTGQSLDDFTLQTVRFFEPDSDKPVTFVLNSDNSPVTGGGLKETNNAIAAWNNSGSRLKLVNGGATTSCGIKLDRNNTISFGDCDDQLDDPINGQGIVSAVMVFQNDNMRTINGNKFNQIIEADIVFNNGFDNVLKVSTNLEELIANSLGLSFGLDFSSTDPNEPSPTLREAIMYFQPHFDGRGARLNPDDQIGANQLYPFFTSINFVTDSLPAPVLNVPYFQQLLVTDGFPGYTYAVTDGLLPSGLTLNMDGTITGTPTAIETQIFEITVTDSANFSFSRIFTNTVTALAPEVDSVSPSRVRYNGDSIITITGKNFLGVSSVNINLGGLVGFQIIDNNTIMAQIVGPGRTGVLGDIRVVNPGGASILRSSLLFDGPQLDSATVAQVRTRNSKGKPVNNRGIIVKGRGLTFMQQITVNGTPVTLTAQRDLITGEIVYFGDLKGVIPDKGSFAVTIIDADLDSESNSVQATRRKQ